MKQLSALKTTAESDRVLMGIEYTLTTLNTNLYFVGQIENKHVPKPSQYFPLSNVFISMWLSQIHIVFFKLCRSKGNYLIFNNRMGFQQVFLFILPKFLLGKYLKFHCLVAYSLFVKGERAAEENSDGATAMIVFIQEVL